MTVVNIDLRVPGPSGPRPSAGRVAWTPVDRHASGAYVLLPAVTSVALVAGVATVDLEPGVYWVEEKTTGGSRGFRLVPATGPAAYADLAEIDPATLEPTAAPDPAWLAMARATVSSAAVVDGDLVLTRTDGGTVNAGNVRGADGQDGADAVVDQAALWKSDWVGPYVRAAVEPPLPVDTPAVSYFAGEVTALTTPVEYKLKGIGGATQVNGWDGQDDPVFRLTPGVFYTANGGSLTKAMYGFTKPGGGSQAAEWPLMVSFTTSAQTVEVFFYSKATTTTPLVKVDGRQLTDVIPVRTVTGNSFTMTLAFPTAKSRTIEVCGVGGLGMIGARVPTGLTITKPAAPKRKVATIGDSFVNGAGVTGSGAASGANVLETFAPRLARFLGADATILAGIGGTGWVAGMDGATPNPYSTRLATVLAMNPHVLVFYGSINDGTAGAGVQAAVTSLLAQCTAVPEVYVIGPLLNGYAANNAAVKAGTLAAGRVFIDLGDFMFGTGKVDAPKGDGNRDFFLYTDGIHPTLNGHKAIAESAFRRIYARNQ